MAMQSAIAGLQYYMVKSIYSRGGCFSPHALIVNTEFHELIGLGFGLGLCGLDYTMQGHTQLLLTQTTLRRDDRQ